MPFIIGGKPIKSKYDYLSKGKRTRLNLVIREDLKSDIVDLSKHTKISIGVMFDTFVEMLQADEELLKKFLNECKKY